MMKKVNQYFLEYLLIAIVLLLTITGFWKIYFGADANPNWYHNLHVVTNFTWLLLLLYQLSLIDTHRFRQHRTVGASILVVGSLLFATTALLSVHSAHKGLVSGRGDSLIVQNVMVTLEVGFFILMAFVLRKRRKLHGSFLLSTTILFMGIALFFTLISLVPGFKIEGPETFYRFARAGMTGQAICLLVGTLFFIKDWRHGWPFLLAGSFHLLNELLSLFLATRKLIDPLTEFVGGMSQPITFVGSLAVLAAALAATGVRPTKRTRGAEPMATIA